MAQPTRDELLSRAISKSTGGRDNAGSWLAQQLIDNRYADIDAETIMLDYAAAVTGNKQEPYTDREAMATLRSARRRAPRGAWRTGKDNNAPRVSRQQYKLHQAQRQLNGDTPRPPVEPNQEQANKLQRAIKHCQKLEGTPGAVYLASRGIPLQLAVDAGSAYCEKWPFSRETDTGSEWVKAPAVVFAIRNENIPCDIVAAQGRRIEAWEGINKTTFGQKSLGVFATKGALNADPVAITEAPIDALALALVGLPAIATCGTGHLPQWVITQLAKRRTPTKSRTVYLAFDADPAGDKQAAETKRELALVKAIRLRPEGAKDWNAVLTGMGQECLAAYITTVTADDIPGLQAESWGDIPTNDSLPCPEVKVCKQLHTLTSRELENRLQKLPIIQRTAEEQAADISTLADRIRQTLGSMPMPIRIRLGEQITDLDLFAKAEARSIITGSPFIAGPAKERLALLGISSTH